MKEKLFFPANGFEGYCFQENNCYENGGCIHLKENTDNCCVLLRYALLEQKPNDFWVFDEEGTPTCKKREYNEQ